MEHDYPVYKNGDWLIQFRLSVYDYQNDGLAIDSLKRIIHLKKLSKKEQNRITQEISQPDPYKVIEKAMFYIQTITTIDEFDEFVNKSQECQLYSQDYILSKISLANSVS